MGTLRPAKIHGSGTSEAEWRQSGWLSATPLRDADNLLRGCARLVVVSPHPDDEVLGCGGLLFRARQLGLEILVVAVTDGEACYPDDPLWTPECLATMRARELAAAMRELGVDQQCIRALRIPDGQIALHESDLRRRLAELFQAGDLVLVTWHADGHPDHEATGRACLDAATDGGVTVCEFPVWAWHWMSADEHSSPWAGGQRYRMNADASMAKLRALRCFISQTDRSAVQGRRPILPAHVLARFQRDYEVVLHGTD